MTDDVINHYDMLVEEGNDPVLDPPPLQEYMDKWDGKIFLDLLELNGQQSVLEIGCGTGRLALKTAPHSKEFFGIDISPKTIETAKTHLPFDNVTLICDDFMTHRFSNKFDVIYSSLTFMHIRDKSKAVGRVFELLNPRGRFVLSIDKNQAKTIDLGTRSVEIYPDTPENINELLKQNSFSEIEEFETEFAYLFLAKK